MRFSKTNNPRSILKFDFRRKAQPTDEVVQPTRPSIRLGRLMGLAIHFEVMLRAGEVQDYSELAARYGVDRARISRIMHLRLLAPDIQEHLLNLEPSDDHLSLKHMLPVCKLVSWRKQRKRFRSMYRP